MYVSVAIRKDCKPMTQQIVLAINPMTIAMTNANLNVGAHLVLSI